MIRADKGEFKLDDYNLVINPELSLAAFRAGDIPISEKWDERKHSAIYRFRGCIDRMPAMFWITFASEKLCLLRFWEDVVLYDQKAIDQEIFAATKMGHDAYLATRDKWSKFTSQIRAQQQQRHDAWLEKVIGVPPPYEYDNWGEIISLIDPRDGPAEILVRFKYAFGEDVDLKTYFENRREQEHRLAMNPPKPLVPGQLPPGFSRKI
jgi:hypothetical protein